MSEDEVDLVSLRRRFAGFQIGFADQNLYLGEILLVLMKDITYQIKVVRIFFLIKSHYYYMYFRPQSFIYTHF